MATRFLLLLAAVTSWGGANAAREVCVEGFVMDKFCIDRGTLLDDPSVKTLENPEKHSVHCLVDVSLCYNSGFNILQPNPSGSPAYTNAIRLDDVGNQKVLEVARANGICSTCGNGGTIRKGLRGTFFGTITQEATDSKPATLAVKNMTVSLKTLDPNSMSDGCPRGANKTNLTLSTEAASAATPTITHGGKPNFTLSTEAASAETPTITHGSKPNLTRSTGAASVETPTIIHSNKPNLTLSTEAASAETPTITHGSKPNLTRSTEAASVETPTITHSNTPNLTLSTETVSAETPTITHDSKPNLTRSTEAESSETPTISHSNKPNLTLSTEAASAETPTITHGSKPNFTRSTEADSSETPTISHSSKPNLTLSTDARSSETPTIAHGATASQRSVKMTICGIVTAVLLVQILHFL